MKDAKKNLASKTDVNNTLDLGDKQKKIEKLQTINSVIFLVQVILKSFSVCEWSENLSIQSKRFSIKCMYDSIMVDY